MEKKIALEKLFSLDFYTENQTKISFYLKSSSFNSECSISSNDFVHQLSTSNIKITFKDCINQNTLDDNFVKSAISGEQDLLLEINKSEIIRILSDYNPHIDSKNTIVWYSLKNIDLSKEIILNIKYIIQVENFENPNNQVHRSDFSIVTTFDIITSQSHTIDIPSLLYQEEYNTCLEHYEYFFHKNITHPEMYNFNSNENCLIEFNRHYCKETIAFFSDSTVGSTFVIRGENYLKLCLNQLLKNFNDINHKNWRKLNNFMLEPNKNRFFDKITIAKQILSGNLHDNSTFNSIDAVLGRITQDLDLQYEMYVENEIKNFLDQKNKILLEAIDTSRGIKKDIQQIQEQTNKYFLTSITAILTTVVLNGSKIIENNIAIATAIVFFIFCTVIFLLTNATDHLNTSKQNVENSRKYFENYFIEISKDNKVLETQSVIREFIQPSINLFTKNYRELKCNITILHLVNIDILLINLIILFNK